MPTEDKFAAAELSMIKFEFVVNVVGQ